jgi:hypothetical protein
MDKESPEERIENFQIQKIEEQRLEQVFKILAGKKIKIGSDDIKTILKKLHDASNPNKKNKKDAYKPSEAEVELMIWEVDDDADGFVCYDEFIKMYKRCIKDDQGLEPRKLFNLVYFLMFKPTYTGTVTEEDTLELLFVRYGREKLDEEIDAIFGRDERAYAGGYDDKNNFSEREITYPEYIKKVNQRAMDERKRKKEEKKNIIMV